jgi:carnitine O-acetyltransferase
VGSLLSEHFQRETNECTFTHSCASSKHLQTRRFLDTIAQYLQDVQRLVMHICRQANEPTSAFVDHPGLVIEACAGSGLAINHLDDDDDTTLGDDDGEPHTLGYSFYDSISILCQVLTL